VYTAEQTLGAMEASDERIELYPIELASAMTALLRQGGTDAMVAEVWELGAAGEPLDPSGMLGYFMTAVVDRATGEAQAYYDVWGGRRQIEPDAVRLLRDTEVTAAALGVDAARVFSSSGDTRAALAMVETGLALDPRSPSLRVMHATILLDSGGFPQALEELDAAIALRPDGPRELTRLQLRLARAGVLSANGEQAAAREELRESSRLLAELIERWPRFARAHLTLATAYLGLDDAERARVELERAKELSSDSPMLWAVWAQYHLAAGKAELAAADMDRALALDPENWQLRVQAAGVLVEAGAEASARENADEALRLVTADRRETLREYLDEIIGAREATAREPRIAPAESQTGEAPEPALMLGDPSKLRLREPDQTLELDLDTDE
jgi:Tfp pilus assembly protein PilF